MPWLLDQFIMVLDLAEPNRVEDVCVYRRKILWCLWTLLFMIHYIFQLNLIGDDKDFILKL